MSDKFYDEYGDPMCILCGAPNGYPYCSQACMEADKED